MSETCAILNAFGVGRPAEADPPRRPHLRYMRAEGKRLGHSVHLSPWGKGTFRFGWVLGWNGIFWHRAIAVKGPSYWTYGGWGPRKPYSGPPCWQSLGPVACLRWRRRGSLRSDRQFARNMDCTCPRTGWLWPIGFTHAGTCPLAPGREGGDD